MKRSLPPMPPGIARLPMDRGRGLPVAYVTEDRAEDTEFREDPLLPPGWIAMMNEPAPEGYSLPTFGKVNPERQRRAVLLGLCGVCGEKLGRKRYYVSGDWMNEESVMLSEPPVCLPCLKWSMQVCPALLTGRKENNLTVTTDPNRTMSPFMLLNTYYGDPNEPSRTLVDWDTPPRFGVITFVQMVLKRDLTIQRPADSYL